MSDFASRRHFLKYLTIIAGGAVLTACSDSTATLAGSTATATATATPPPASPATTAPAVAAVHFTYEGEDGPENWGTLSKDWAVCSTGQRQSPINITSATKRDTLKDLALNYKPTAINMVNNGHTVQVTYDAGSTFTFNDKKYEVKQFHFHAPSEHTINGTSYGMELHIVHAYSDTDLAVIGVLIQEGAENAVLAKFWNQLPAKEKSAVATGNLNIADALPAANHYYTYDGSLTTPPCSEVVTWVVLETPITASKEQIAAFKTLLGNTARPVEPLDGRVVSEH